MAGMPLLVILGVVVVLVIVAGVIITKQQQKAAAEIGLRYDTSGELFLESLPFTRFAGMNEIEVDSVLTGERDGRRSWLFQLELERLEAGQEIEGEFSAAVIEVGESAEAFLAGAPASSGTIPAAVARYLDDHPDIVTAEVAGPYLLVLVPTLGPSRRPEVLDKAADIARCLSLPM